MGLLFITGSPGHRECSWELTRATLPRSKLNHGLYSYRKADNEWNWGESIKGKKKKNPQIGNQWNLIVSNFHMSILKNKSWWLCVQPFLFEAISIQSALLTQAMSLNGHEYITRTLANNYTPTTFRTRPWQFCNSSGIYLINPNSLSTLVNNMQPLL